MQVPVSASPSLSPCLRPSSQLSGVWGKGRPCLPLIEGDRAVKWQGWALKNVIFCSTRCVEREGGGMIVSNTGYGGEECCCHEGWRDRVENLLCITCCGCTQLTSSSFFSPFVTPSCSLPHSFTLPPRSLTTLLEAGSWKRPQGGYRGKQTTSRRLWQMQSG